MHGKAEFRSSIAFTISFATAVALLVLLVVVATRAQNPVPPTARGSGVSGIGFQTASGDAAGDKETAGFGFAAAEPGDLRERAGQRHD